MDDLIQRQAVFDALRARFGVDFDYGKWWSSTHVLAAIESVPPVTPQEPCEDAISRRTVQDYIAKYLSQYLYNDVREAVEVIEEYIGELPPVKPQYTDAEIQKMQELEQAEIEKAYELGKAERPRVGHWIPVSELPEKAGRYVVTISGTSDDRTDDSIDDKLDTAYFAGGMWYKSKIKAWMPVPPYKEESEDKE